MHNTIIYIDNNTINTSRKLNNNNIPTTRRTGRCCICGAPATYTVTTTRQPRGVKLCERHSGERIFYNLNSYSTENSVFSGTVTQKGISQSLEVEANENTDVAIATLVKEFKCIPSNDGSLGYHGIEFKSPIYCSNQGATKLIGCLEYLNNQKLLNTLDRRCSCHLHTGLISVDKSNKYNFSTIFSNIEEYYSVFGVLYKYLDNMPNTKMIEYFGRGFVSYARTLRLEDGSYVLPCHDGHGKRLRYDDADLAPYDDLVGTGSYNCNQHLLAFNLQHNYSLEFRLVKFVNAKQYRYVMLALQETVLALEKYYILCHDVHKTSDAFLGIWKKYFPY